MQNEGRRFVKNDEGFTCRHCGAEVAPLGYSSRNHCPVCLWSLHLDVMPGDRQAECGGEMRPVRADPDARRGMIITHKCEKCGKITRCKAAADDDRKKLIRLTAGIE